MHKLLNNLITDNNTIEAIAKLAGLNISVISFTNQSYTDWAKEKVKNLLEEVAEVCPNNKALEALIKDIF